MVKRERRRSEGWREETGDGCQTLPKLRVFGGEEGRGEGTRGVMVVNENEALVKSLQFHRVFVFQPLGVTVAESAESFSNSSLRAVRNCVVIDHHVSCMQACWVSDWKSLPKASSRLAEDAFCLGDNTRIVVGICTSDCQEFDPVDLSPTSVATVLMQGWPFHRPKHFGIILREILTRTKSRPMTF